MSTSPISQALKSTPSNPYSVLGHCGFNTRGCNQKAPCSQNRPTATIRSTCKTGYTNIGSPVHVICADSCTINNGGCDRNAVCSHDPWTSAIVARSTMGVAIQTLSVRMMLPHLRQNAPAKLVIPTLEWRRALYAQTPAPSEMEVVIQTPFAHTTTQRMQWFAHAKRVTPILQYRRKLCAQISIEEIVESTVVNN
ncbi:unnamed protein product [Rotaria magnacalcarata]